MKDRYDFSKGKRGRVLPPEPEPEGKTRITIRLDQDIVDRFFQNGGRIRGRDRLSDPHQRSASGIPRRKGAEVRGYAATHHS